MFCGRMQPPPRRKGGGQADHESQDRIFHDRAILHAVTHSKGWCRGMRLTGHLLLGLNRASDTFTCHAAVLLPGCSKVAGADYKSALRLFGPRLAKLPVES